MFLFVTVNTLCLPYKVLSLNTLQFVDSPATLARGPFEVFLLACVLTGILCPGARVDDISCIYFD